MGEYRPAGPLALLDRRASSLGCARCGSCCEVLKLRFDPRASSQWIELPDPSTEDGWAWWLEADHRSEVTKDRDQAIRWWNLKQDGPDGENARFYPGRWHVEWTDADERGTYHVVTCSMYDAVSHLCTAGDRRPPICRDYPWYEHAPRPGDDPGYKRIHDEGPASCSYWLDAPGWSQRGARPLLPVEIL